MLHFFDNPGDLARYCEKPKVKARKGRLLGDLTDDGWTGGSYDEVARLCKVGDPSRVPEAEKLIEKINTDIEAPVREWVAAPAGGFPVVADHLAGSPTPMRYREPDLSIFSPIRIFVSLGCSASVRAKDMEKRGTAALALAIAMQNIRPVELYAFTEMVGKRTADRHNGCCMVKIRLGTSPLSLSHVAHVFGCPGVYRQLCFAVWCEEGHPDTWIPWAKGHPRKTLDSVSPEDPWHEKLRDMLDAQPGDVVLGGEFTPTGLIFTDPTKWVQLEINKHIYREEEGLND